MSRGDYAEARRLYQESLKIAEELGDKSGIAISVGQLGRIAKLEGDYATAVQLWVVALGIFEELRSPKADIVRGWFARLRDELGEERFEEVLAKAQGEGAVNE